jgi:hypothetical protein
VLAAGVVLRAMLQGILQGARPGGWCCKVLMGVLLLGVLVFLSVLFLGLRSLFLGLLFLALLFLYPRSWCLRFSAFLVPGVRILDVAIGSPGGSRLSRQSKLGPLIMGDRGLVLTLRLMTITRILERYLKIS